ncbi:hypothetical protein J2TS6_01420 [Paenibacillus albilobatus]|uniref:histidine kinase n=1 Tax=Paenibacillus albilobatus TaxID=2716884 RepID=A0A919XAE6_9BACL|nr:hypothetical protein J2TS6_01420 [Paenibacillus albilobatus]
MQTLSRLGYEWRLPIMLKHYYGYTYDKIADMIDIPPGTVKSRLPEEQRHQAGIIRRQGEKLRSLVSDLNLVSMLEYEMQLLHLKYIRLSVLGRQVVTEFLNHGLDDRYDIELKLADEAVRIYGDEKLPLRAISNLVQNSVRHNSQSCKITIETSLSQDRSQYRIIVRDNGRGIPQERLAEITELHFLQGESALPSKVTVWGSRWWQGLRRHITATSFL